MTIVLFNMIWEMSTLGLLNIATYLECEGYSAQHVYLTKHEPESKEEINAILSFLNKKQPSLIGFSLMTFNFERTKRITLAIRERFPGIPIVWGGIHPTFNPEESIKYADYVCIGEGEQAMVELLRAFEDNASVEKIPNIWCRQNDHVFKNDVRPLIQNLDDYPFPTINWKSTFCLDNGQIVPLTHNLYRENVMYTGTMYDIMVSRGCPYSCSYCCNSLFRSIYRNKGKYVRYRSVDSVMLELNYVKREFPYVNMINIQDDGFAAASEDYLKEFSIKYREQIGYPLRLRIIPTQITENKIKYLAEANTLVGVMGIQSSDRINKEIFNRKVSSKTLIDTAKLLKKYGIVGQYDLIVRNPYETEADMVDICNILSQIPKPYQLACFPLAFFPNTVLREKAIKDDTIEINESDGYITPYGNYPVKYPYLYKLQIICPYTPGFIIRFFLRNRHSKFFHSILAVYYSLIYKTIDKLRELIMHNTMFVAVTKKIIFLPQKLIRLLKK
jgi:anaerobic magnesium-protoporphyrin IX monomethyl ester cyclase